MGWGLRVPELWLMPLKHLKEVASWTHKNTFTLTFTPASNLESAAHMVSLCLNCESKLRYDHGEAMRTSHRQEKGRDSKWGLFCCQRTVLLKGKLSTKQQYLTLLKNISYSKCHNSFLNSAIQSQTGTLTCLAWDPGFQVFLDHFASTI